MIETAHVILFYVSFSNIFFRAITQLEDSCDHLTSFTRVPSLTLFNIPHISPSKIIWSKNTFFIFVFLLKHSLYSFWSFPLIAVHFERIKHITLQTAFSTNIVSIQSTSFLFSFKKITEKVPNLLIKKI